jgi:hypothetical protein
MEICPAYDSQSSVIGKQASGPQLLHSGVGVEKLEISENQHKFGDRKCLGDSYKSFVGHPDAI